MRPLIHTYRYVVQCTACDRFHAADRAELIPETCMDPRCDAVLPRPKEKATS